MDKGRGARSETRLSTARVLQTGNGAWLWMQACDLEQLVWRSPGKAALACTWRYVEAGVPSSITRVLDTMEQHCRRFVPPRQRFHSYMLQAPWPLPDAGQCAVWSACGAVNSYTECNLAPPRLLQLMTDDTLERSPQPFGATSHYSSAKAIDAAPVQRGNDGAQDACRDDGGARQVKHPPAVDEGVRRLGLSNARLGCLVLQGRGREVAHLGLQLVVGGHDEDQSEGDDAGEQHGGCDIELEGQRRGVLCPASAGCRHSGAICGVYVRW